MEEKYRALAKKVKQDDLISSQVNNLFQAGILNQDDQGNLVVAGGVSLNEFQDCDKEDEDMPEHDARRKQKRYNDFGSSIDANAQHQDNQSAHDENY